VLFDSVISRISIRKATAACFLLLAVARFSPAASTIRAVPTTARNLRSEKIADPDHRVTVQGVITAFSGWKNSFFLQETPVPSPSTAWSRPPFALATKWK
jgi:hypothetical protein